MIEFEHTVCPLSVCRERLRESAVKLAVPATRDPEAHGAYRSSAMSSSSFAPILLNSFKAIASLFLQYVIGAVVAWVGVIKEGDMRAFSAIMNAVLIPLLSVVSLGRGLSPVVFASDGWMLALLGLFGMFLYAALAFALRPLAKPEPEFRRIFVLMMSIGNVVAIPLSVTQSLCELGVFEAELAEAECLIRSRALVFTSPSLLSRSRSLSLTPTPHLALTLTITPTATLTLPRCSPT